MLMKILFVHIRRYVVPLPFILQFPLPQQNLVFSKFIIYIGIAKYEFKALQTKFSIYYVFEKLY